MIIIPTIFADNGTLVGAPVVVTISGFVAKTVEVQNLDSANTYTVTLGTATVSLPPQTKVKVQVLSAGLSEVTIDGTGDYQVLASGDNTDIELSAISGLTPENAGAIQSVDCVLLGLAAGADLSSTFLWLNNSPDKTVQVLAATLIPKSTVTTLGGGQTCTVEVKKTGGNAVTTAVVFDDNPGGAGVNWPAYTGPGEVFPLTLTAVAADLLLAPGEALFADVTQTAASAVGEFALQFDYRVLV